MPLCFFKFEIPGYIEATSFTADMNTASVASFPGHLMILSSGNLCEEKIVYRKSVNMPTFNMKAVICFQPFKCQRSITTHNLEVNCKVPWQGC